ncbi:MAG: M24 family metallopeptidase [Pseudomonadales bacterium]
MSVSRRDALRGLASAGMVAGAASCAQNPIPEPAGVPSALAPDLPPLAQTPLLNKARAVAEMEAAGVDLLFCSDPVNVLYLTNYQIVSNLLGMDGLAYASFSPSGDFRPALLTGKFSYYLASGDYRMVPTHVNLKLFTTPAEPDLYATLADPTALAAAPASAGYITPTFDRAPARDYESSRRESIAAATAEVAASAEALMLRELLATPLPNKTVAVDDPRLIPWLQKSGLDLNFIDGERLLRRIRLQKTPAELAYARYAAAANAAAGLEAAQTVRAGATFRELQQEFARQAGTRMTRPVYILIDGVITPLAEHDFRPGRTFMIDCVSTFEGYHGDYGRTVCVGEPDRAMQQVVDALSYVWDRVLPELKAGVQYSDIWALGQKLFAQTKVDAGLVMGPHAVGLHHTDEPGATDFAPFSKENLTLQENMVLSVDMPVLGSGLGGTAHLEDLVLIGKDGPELLNPTSDRFIVV